MAAMLAMAADDVAAAPLKAQADDAVAVRAALRRIGTHTHMHAYIGDDNRERERGAVERLVLYRRP
jgi:hypothetical protein